MLQNIHFDLENMCGIEQIIPKSKLSLLLSCTFIGIA